MERKGGSLDTEFLAAYSVVLGADQSQLQEAIFEEAGVRFNLDPPKHVGEFLFLKMKIQQSLQRISTLSSIQEPKTWKCTCAFQLF